MQCRRLGTLFRGDTVAFPLFRRLRKRYRKRVANTRRGPLPRTKPLPRPRARWDVEHLEARMMLDEDMDILDPGVPGSALHRAAITGGRAAFASLLDNGSAIA